MRDDVFHRVVTMLWPILTRAKGGISAAEKHLGRGRNFLWTRKKRRTLDLDLLGQLLDFLKVPPAWFFRRAFPLPPGALSELLLEAESLRQEAQEPELLNRLRSRWLEKPKQRYAGPESSQPAEVEQLERLRLRDAPSTVAQAETLAGQANRPEIVASVLGVWASALRSDPHALDAAFLVLTTALEVAHLHGLPSCLGRQYQRMSYLLSERGQPDRGLACADAALVLYSELGDRRGQGKAHVDRAVMQVHSGDLAAAQSAYRAALRLLPNGEARNIAACHQGLAFCLEQMGKLPSARGHLEQAVSVIPTDAMHHRAQLQWVRARILVREGRLQPAESLYADVVAAMADRTTDCILATAEWLELLQHLGRHAESRALCIRLGALLPRLPAGSQLEAAAMRLYRAGQGGERLSSSLIQAAVAHIRAAGASDRLGATGPL